MAEQKIEFRKTRDFGENLNDTFRFIGLNFKSLFKSFFAICAIFMLAQAVLSGMYLSRFSGVWSTIFNRRSPSAPQFGQIFNVQYFLLILFGLLTFISTQVALCSYIKYAAENDGKKPGIDEIWAIFRKYFFRIFLYSIPIILTIIIGCIFCLLPGIYFWVVFAPFSMVVMMEDKDLGGTYQRCFELIKENFWSSFGLYLVVYIIYYICALIVVLLGTAIVKFGSYFTTSNLDPTLTMITSFLNIFSFCFYIIYLVSVALNYFNLVEIKDGTGILNRINKIGGNKSDLDKIEEEY